MPQVNETWALAESTVNYFCRLMNGAEIPLVLRDGHVMEALGRVADHFDERARLLVSTGLRGRGVRVIALRHHG